MLCTADSEKAKSWSLVVAKENCLTPICTVSLDLVPRVKETMDISEVLRHAADAFSDHLKGKRLIAFFFNPHTQSYCPAPAKCSGEHLVHVKFLPGQPWINVNEVPIHAMEQFLDALGLRSINYKLAAMATRMAPFLGLRAPIYDCE